MYKFIWKRMDHEHISRDLLLLLLIGGLYSLGLFLSNTFVNVYLWRQTNNYLTIAFYNLAIFVFQPITFIFAGRLAKKMDRIIVLRLGVIFLSMFFLTVLLLAESAAYFNVLLGSLLGIGYGFYWLAFNVLTFEITEPETRDFFNGFMGGLQSLAGMIGPVVAGGIISRMATEIGYMTVFSISFSLFILAVICSFFLNRRSATGKYDLLTAFLECKQNTNLTYLSYANIFQGMREGIFFFVVAIWIFLTTNSELALGMFNLFLHGFSFVFYFVVTKIIHPETRKRAIFIGSALISFSVCIILFKTTYTLLIVYAMIIGVAYPILNVPYQSMSYDVIGQANYIKELRIEYVVLLEVFLNLGRIISIVVFIVTLLVFSQNEGVSILLGIFSFSYLMIYFFMRKIN